MDQCLRCVPNISFKASGAAKAFDFLYVDVSQVPAQATLASCRSRSYCTGCEAADGHSGVTQPWRDGIGSGTCDRGQWALSEPPPHLDLWNMLLRIFSMSDFRNVWFWRWSAPCTSPRFRVTTWPAGRAGQCAAKGPSSERMSSSDFVSNGPATKHEQSGATSGGMGSLEKASNDEPARMGTGRWCKITPT